MNNGPDYLTIPLLTAAILCFLAGCFGAYLRWSDWRQSRHDARMIAALFESFPPEARDELETAFQKE